MLSLDLVPPGLRVLSAPLRPPGFFSASDLANFPWFHPVPVFAAVYLDGSNFFVDVPQFALRRVLQNHFSPSLKRLNTLKVMHKPVLVRHGTIMRHTWF